MSRNYKFHNPDGAYYVSFAVIEWLDVFTRAEYINIPALVSCFSPDNINKTLKGLEKK